MLLYQNFTTNSTGHVNSTANKYCNQFNNASLYDCSQADPTYMPLSRFAQKSWDYSRDQKMFYEDMIHAFIDMTSVPSENDSGSYSEITSAWECVSEQDPVTGTTTHFLQCQADVFLLGCAGFSQPSCP